MKKKTKSQLYCHKFLDIIIKSQSALNKSNFSLPWLEGGIFKQSQTDLQNGQDGTAHVTPGGGGTSPARQWRGAGNGG